MGTIFVPRGLSAKAFTLRYTDLYEAPRVKRFFRASNILQFLAFHEA
jgi:hypothetical protein